MRSGFVLLLAIGIGLAAQATPDGHTLALVNPSHAINATLMAKLPYDPVRDLTPITVAVTQPYAVCITNALPAKTVKDVIALAKARPGELNMASSGPGSASHLAGEMFNNMAGTKMTHVPYKGTGAVMPDLMSGRLHFYINPMLAMLSYKENVDALAKAGNDPVASTPKEAMEFLKVEIARWGKVIKMAGVAPQ